MTNETVQPSEAYIVSIVRVPDDGTGDTEVATVNANNIKENEIHSVSQNSNLIEVSNKMIAKYEEIDSYQKMEAKHGAWENSGGMRVGVGWVWLVISCIILSSYMG